MQSELSVSRPIAKPRPQDYGEIEQAPEEFVQALCAEYRPVTKLELTGTEEIDQSAVHDEERHRP
jgi:hypothetical protein